MQASRALVVARRRAATSSTVTRRRPTGGGGLPPNSKALLVDKCRCGTKPRGMWPFGSPADPRMVGSGVGRNVAGDLLWRRLMRCRPSRAHSPRTNARREHPREGC